MGSRLCSTSGALASSFCGEWRRNGARGERRQRGVGRTPAADPQPEACATSGQRDPVPQLYFSLLLPEMWYGVFLWALVSSLFFHVPAGLLALFTLRHHKYGAAIAGVYRAAGKQMIPFEALTLGTGQTFCVVLVSFLRILATL